MATAIPAAVRAAAIADLATGSSLHAVAARYHVSRTTVQRWQRGALRPVPQNDRDEIGDLVTAALRAQLRFLATAATFAADPAYLATQQADHLGILIGIISDKAFRVLEALERASHPDDQPDPLP